jgi:hypothetical protein
VFENGLVAAVFLQGVRVGVDEGVVVVGIGSEFAAQAITVTVAVDGVHVHVADARSRRDLNARRGLPRRGVSDEPVRAGAAVGGTEVQHVRLAFDGVKAHMGDAADRGRVGAHLHTVPVGHAKAGRQVGFARHGDRHPSVDAGDERTVVMITVVVDHARGRNSARGRGLVELGRVHRVVGQSVLGNARQTERKSAATANRGDVIHLPLLHGDGFRQGPGCVFRLGGDGRHLRPRLIANGYRTGGRVEQIDPHLPRGRRDKLVAGVVAELPAHGNGVGRGQDHVTCIGQPVQSGVKKQPTLHRLHTRRNVDTRRNIETQQRS